MSECERLFTGKLGSGRADELFPNERHQVRVDGATKAIRRELAHRADVKDLPSTAASSMIARSSCSRRSSLAARSA